MPARTEGPATIRGVSVAQQRRTLAVLAVAQVLSGAGLAAGIAVGALLAQEMLGATDLAGIPVALFTAGSAAAAVSIGRISQRAGRRRGLAFGYAVGALGGGGVVVAAVTGSPVLLFASLFVYGAGTAANSQARYAGADLASPAHRGRAVSVVLVATTLGAVAGPNLISATGELAAAWALPRLSGPFVLAGVAYAAAAAVLWALLRPDPLLLARSLAATDTAQHADVVREPGSRDRKTIMLAAAVMVTAQLVMVAIMTMTPVHMTSHGHSMGATGAVIAIHVAFMFLPSPFSGWLVDRVGPLAVATMSGAVLLLAGLAAGLGPPQSVWAMATGLALLGLGWNLGLVAGTAMLTNAVPLASRARTQGTVELAMAVAGAGGGLGSGIAVAETGFAGLCLMAGVIALALVPVAALGSARVPRAQR